jgi:LuxR family maltose regulon positive regulatory protein
MPTLAPQRAAFHRPLDVEVVDQISRTVHQLLIEALERTRQMPEVAAPSSMPVLAMLSSRECEVLERIAAGDSNKMIARGLALSPHTVKRHVANILDKLDLRSRGQAAAWWLTQRQRRADQ